MRRQRAEEIAAGAARGGLLAGAVAVAAWLVVSIVAGTAFVVLLVVTVLLAALTAIGGRDMPGWLWGALAVAWAVVLVERWAVHGHGGLWVAVAAWLGVVAGARGAAIPRWALPLLAYPAISVAIVILADESLPEPWGVSWLWVAAVLGPPLGVKVLLDSLRSPAARARGPARARRGA
jgi:hypothetical protein